jgi:hypothetical protein
MDQAKLRLRRAPNSKVEIFEIVGRRSCIEGDRLFWRLLSRDRAIVMTPLHREDGSAAEFIPPFKLVEIAPVRQRRLNDVADALNSLALGGKPSKAIAAAVRDLAYRADFKAGKSSVRVYLSDCQVDILDGEDCRLLPVDNPRPEPKGIKNTRHEVFNAELTRATLRIGKEKARTIALEPEQTKLVKRILDEPGRCVERRKLVEERVVGAQPEKYFQRGALKELWDAGVIGRNESGRLTTYWVKPFLD